MRKAGISPRILVLGDFLHYEPKALAAAQLTPVVHSLARLHDLSSFDDAARHASHLRFEGLIAHLASANDCTTSLV